jgi:hypothetical protein
MEHAHYVVLFAGLIFGNNPAANDRSGAAGDRLKRDAVRFEAFNSALGTFMRNPPLHHLCACKRTTWACNAAKEYAF